MSPLDPLEILQVIGYSIGALLPLWMLFQLVTLLLTYFILRFQHLLPLNPRGLAGIGPDGASRHRRDIGTFGSDLRAA